jgi:hypothetical protein
MACAWNPYFLTFNLWYIHKAVRICKRKPEYSDGTPYRIHNLFDTGRSFWQARIPDKFAGLCKGAICAAFPDTLDHAAVNYRWFLELFGPCTTGADSSDRIEFLQDSLQAGIMIRYSEDSLPMCSIDLLKSKSSLAYRKACI